MISNVEQHIYYREINIFTSGGKRYRLTMV